MPARRRYYLNLGSNILPEQHLATAVRLMRGYGQVAELSSVWESEAVGSDGPNFLNAAVRLDTEASDAEVKQNVVRGIESALSRSRTSDKNAPRTIDIDILLEDGRALNKELWRHAFVILPMAELLPDLVHPLTGRRLADEAPLAAAALWIRRRPDVLLERE